MQTQRPSALDFSPAPGLDAVPEGASAPENTNVATGVGTLPGSSGGSLAAPSGAAAQSGASPPMKGVHVAPIPPWKGCEISRVNGAADQMRASASRSKPNAAWSVHAGDAFAFLASGSSAGHGTARRDGKRLKRNVSFTESAPESVVIPSVLCQTPRRLQRSSGDRELPSGATDEGPTDPNLDPTVPPPTP